LRIKQANAASDGKDTSAAAATHLSGDDEGIEWEALPASTPLALEPAPFSMEFVEVMVGNG
jgi:hypothetical protein